MGEGSKIYLITKGMRQIPKPSSPYYGKPLQPSQKQDNRCLANIRKYSSEANKDYKTMRNSYKYY